MLFVLFSIESDRFVVESRRVVEVVPLVYWKTVPEGAPGVVGLINFRRTAVPLVDMSRLIMGRPAPTRMSARIIVVRTERLALNAALQGDTFWRPRRAQNERNTDLLALLVSRVDGTFRCEPSQFVPPPELTDTAPYLGPILTDGQGIIQHVEIDQLLLPAAREGLATYATQVG